MRSRLALLALVLLPAASSAGVRPEPTPAARVPITDVFTRLIGDRARELRVETIPKVDGRDALEIESRGRRLVLRGSSQNAIGYAFHLYLKRYCHSQVSLAGVQVALPRPLPRVRPKLRLVSPYRQRYFLNYCTFNYTASFWDWERWERELDWMALHGVNMPLAMVGHEAVWQRTLRRFGFSEREIGEFIPGPAYTAWWLMGNLEGWGGPVSQAWIDDRAELEQKILARMRALDMQPVLHGFYGMVPRRLKQKYPDHRILDQGTWGGPREFLRPALLDPQDDLFAQMAKAYYEEQTKLYGPVDFYGGDPFHEGGDTTGIDVTAGARAIQDAMLAAHPDSKWLLQGWEGNPKDALLAGTRPGHVIVLDEMAEDRPTWEKRAGFGGRNWIWCNILNFGSKVGMYGRLEAEAHEPLRARTTPAGQSLIGIGLAPEGATTNPISYELLFDMAWQSQPPDMAAWLTEFARSRYGRSVDEAEEAWRILYKEVYQKGTDTETVMCARPRLGLDRVTTWGSTKIAYDPAQLDKAARLLLGAADTLGDIDTYRYDLVDVVRQTLWSVGQARYAEMVDAYNRRDATAFDLASARLLELLSDEDDLLATRTELMLGPWLEAAKARTTTDAERRLFEWNARTLITVWGPVGVEADLHDYSYREWSGMMGTFYRPRWEMFIQSARAELAGHPEPPPDFYAWESAWTRRTDTYPSRPTGDPAAVAGRLVNKYAQ